MAAIFQIRRGTSNATLADGELYLHKGLGSVQFSSGSANPITLLPLGAPVSGNIVLQGNITASNAYFTGDVAISGNLFLGNNTSDNINALGVFTSDIKPGTTNEYNIGTTTAVWANVYANNISASSFTGSFSGSIGGIDFNVFSTSVDSRLDQLEIDSGSQNTRITGLESKATTLQTYTASINTRIDQLATDTGSQNTRITTLESKATTLQTYTTSVDSRLSSLETDSGSQNTRITTLESKATTLQTYTSSVNEHISDINVKTGSFETKFSTLETYTTSVDSRINSVENYTQSLRDNIEVGIGNIRILGDLIVDGDTTYLNTANLYVEDKVITLASGSTNSGAADGAGFEIAGANVSMSWQNANNRFEINTDLAIVGYVSASTFTGLNGVSLTSYSTSVDSRLTNLQSKSASVDISISEINNFTSSQNQKDVIISNITSSYNGFTGSATASIVELFATASNHEVRIDDLESKATTLQTYTASVNGHISDINSYTSSNNTLNSLQTTRIDQLAASTASVNSFSASATASIVELFGTASNHESRIDDLESKATTLQTYTASVENRFTTISDVTSSLNLHTASLNQFTSSTYSTFSTSVDLRLDQLEYTTSILTPEGQAEAFAGLNTFTGSANNRLNNLEITSASLNAWSSSLNTTFATDSELNAVSLSISTSVEILSQSVDGRLDNVELFTSSINTTIKTKLNTDGVISGSSQLTSSLVQVSQTSSMAVLAATTVTVAASNTTNDSTLYPTFTNNIANGTTQLKSHPSGTFYFDGITRKVYGETFVGAIEATNGVVSGSIQVLGGTGIISSSAQIDTLFNLDGIVSGSNQLTGSLVDLASAQTITGTKTFDNIVVNGTGSFAYITSVSGSAKIIGDSYVVLNNDTPTQRYAGIAVYDSGSATPTTASFNFDGETNDWFYEYSSSTVDYGVVLFGPEYNTKGTATYPTNNKVQKGTGTHHLSDSNITDTGTLITLGSNSVVNGTFYATGTTLVSGSAQVLDMLSSLNTYTGSNDTLNTLQTTRIDQLAASTASVNSFTESVLGHIADINTYTGSNNSLNSLQTTRIDQLAAATASVNSFTSSIDTTIKTKLNVEGVVSGSSQITLSSTTGGGTTANVQFGSLGIGTTASGVSGEIRATGDIVAFYSSDERLKENITPIQNAVDKINQMGGYNYDWKEGFETIHSHKGHDLGVIAQEVQSVLPEVVTERETGYLAVDYVKLVPVLIEAIKELSAKIDRLEKK